MKNEHVRDGHVKDAAQDVGGGVTQDVAEDGLSSVSGGTHATLPLRWHVRDEHVRDGPVKDAAEDVAENVTQDVAEDVLAPKRTEA